MSAEAHPLGNFTINAAAAVRLTPGEARVFYALDFAEIPTFQLLQKIDPDGDPEPDELTVWATRRADELRDGISLTVDGAVVSLDVRASGAVLFPGQGALTVLRLDAEFSGEIPAGGSAQLIDGNYTDRIGWREITASAGDGTIIESTSVPRVSPSEQLTRYPGDRLTSPPDVRRASFVYRPGSGGEAASVPEGPSASQTQGGSSRLADLVARRDLSPGLVLLAFAIALGVGALHALAPGHGKTITAAYLAGSAGKARDAFTVALAVAGMHTATVLGLSIILYLLSETFAVERIYPWLGILAGAAAVALGVALLRVRLREGRAEDQRSHGEGGHVHVSKPGIAALALSGGLLPSPSAVVILLGSFTLGRAGLGVGLVAAFGIGLAATLAAIGLITVRAREFAQRRLSGRLARAVPLAGAGAIAAMGLVVAGRAVTQL